MELVNQYSFIHPTQKPHVGIFDKNVIHSKIKPDD